MRYCINCGAMNDTDAKFCQGCGKKFDSAPAENPNADQTDNIKTDYTTENINSSYGNDNGQFYQDRYNGYDQYNQYRQYDQYGQNPYGYDQYNPNRGQYVPQGKAKGYGMAGFVLGIVSIVLAWPCVIFTMPAAIVGLILSSKSLKAGPYGIAKAGRILSIIGIVFNAFWLALVIIFLFTAQAYDIFDWYNYY